MLVWLDALELVRRTRAGITGSGRSEVNNVLVMGPDGEQWTMALHRDFRKGVH
jgi:hypothetical protein